MSMSKRYIKATVLVGCVIAGSVLASSFQVTEAGPIVRERVKGAVAGAVIGGSQAPALVANWCVNGTAKPIR